MPIKMNHLAILDTETSGLDITKAQPIEIACVIYNARSLEPIPGASFNELCKPTDDCIIEDAALEKNKIKREDIAKAPSIKVVFPKFVEFIEKYNLEKNKWTAPIAVGHNIDSYDLPIINRMRNLFCKKKDKQVIFNEMRTIDLMDIAFLWFENTKELENYKLDSLRKLMGLSTDGAHRALKDVEDCGKIITRFLKFHRELSVKYIPKIRDCFKGASPPNTPDTCLTEK